MSRFMRRNGLPALVLVAAISTAHAADKVTITFANWATAEGTTRPAIEKVIADFEKAHPDIAIKSESISFSEIARQLALRVRAGNPPDVAQLAGNDTFVLAATGKLEPLDRYVDAGLKSSLKPESTRDLAYRASSWRCRGRWRRPASGTTSSSCRRRGSIPRSRRRRSTSSCRTWRRSAKASLT